MLGHNRPSLSITAYFFLDVASMQHLVTNRKKCGDYYKRNEIFKWDERGDIRNLLVGELAPTEIPNRPRSSVIVTESPNNAMRGGMWNGRASRRTQGSITK